MMQDTVVLAGIVTAAGLVFCGYIRMKFGVWLILACMTLNLFGPG